DNDKAATPGRLYDFADKEKAVLVYVALMVGAAVCAAQAVRAQKLLASVLWLAGVSVLLSIVFYLMGAAQIAVIELSVGAGLITVLFVFAISLAGDEGLEAPPIVPRSIAGLLVAFAVALLGLQILPFPAVEQAGATAPFAEVLWQERGLDVLVQLVLIFVGVVGVLGLIGHPQEAADELEEIEGGISDVVSHEYSPAGRPEPDGHRPLRPVDYPQPD